MQQVVVFAGLPAAFPRKGGDQGGDVVVGQVVQDGQEGFVLE